jgi:uncharacterized DUF497 family protein
MGSSTPNLQLTKLLTVVTIQPMRFDWDESKRLANIKKHGVDFADAATIFDSDVFTIEDQRFDYGETRYITFGLFQSCVIVVAHTDDNETIRIISARKASKHEAEQFFKEIGY